MNLNTRNVVLIIAGIGFAFATIWVHYEVKAKLVPSSGLGIGGVLGITSKYKRGDAISDFSGIGLDGEFIAMSDLRGQQVVVVDFWATWCKPCVNGMPALQELHEEFGERGVTVLAVNVGEQAETVRNFIKTAGYEFTVVMDGDSKIKEEFGVGGIPQLFVVGRDGLLKHTSIGYPPSPEGARKKTQALKKLLLKLHQESAPVSRV